MIFKKHVSKKIFFNLNVNLIYYLYLPLKEMDSGKH